jgi:hypothetical protein
MALPIYNGGTGRTESTNLWIPILCIMSVVGIVIFSLLVSHGTLYSSTGGVEVGNCFKHDYSSVLVHIDSMRGDGNYYVDYTYADSGQKEVGTNTRSNTNHTSDYDEFNGFRSVNKTQVNCSDFYRLKYDIQIKNLQDGQKLLQGHLDDARTEINVLQREHK